jgi:hypothetical protein
MKWLEYAIRALIVLMIALFFALSKSLSMGGPKYGIYLVVASIILLAFLADWSMKKASRAVRTLA